MSLSDNAGATAAPGTSLAHQGFSPLEAENGHSAQAWTRSALRLAVLSLVIFCALAQAAWLFSGTVVPWDSKNHFYAMFRFLGDALHHGEIPLWNP
ncbi:MAG: YfhO family protein, partial [Methylocella sp.]